MTAHRTIAATVELSARPFSGVSTDDIPAAQRFYADTLGLPVDAQNGMLTVTLDEGSHLLVYPKPDHTPAAFTVLNFPVRDIEQAARALAGRGVRFKRYDESQHDELGVFRGGGPPIAWFTDPAGNILSIIEV